MVESEELLQSIRAAAGLSPLGVPSVIPSFRKPHEVQIVNLEAEETNALERSKRSPIYTPLGWHFEDYGLLLNRIRDEEQVSKRVRILPTPWAQLNFKDAAAIEENIFESSLGRDPKLLAELASAAIIGQIEVNDYIDMDRGENLFFLRLRSDFQFYNEDVEGVTVNWERDYTSDSGDFFEFHGAVMLDAYLSPVYHFNIADHLPARLNRDRIGNRLKQSPSRAFFRFGAEWDRSANGSEDDEDVRKYFGLFSFWTERPLLNLYRSDSPQLMQLGAMFEDDALNDIQNLKFVFNWEPRLQLMRGFNDSGLGQLFSIGRRIFFARGNPLAPLNLNSLMSAAGGQELSQQALDTTEFIRTNGNSGTLSIAGINDLRSALLKERKRSFDYFFLRPKLGLEQIFDQSGLVQGGIAEEDLTFALRLKAGFTMFRELATVSYNVVGQGSLQDYDGLAVMHELRLDVKFFPRMAGDDRPGEFRPFAKGYLAYQNGEEAPSFRKVDRIAAGLSFQF